MKLHNYLIAFAGLLIFLTFGHVVVIYKYFLVLLHHGLYYCQEMAKSLNFQLPGEYGKILAGVLILAGVFTLSKLFGSIFNVFSFRKELLNKKNEHHDNLISLFVSLDLHEKVLIFTQDKPQAFCFGIRNPKIYISTGLIQMMDQKELEVILRHEKYHLEHRDTLTLLLATIVESLFPFFPVVSDFIRVYRTDREVAADKAAMQSLIDKQSLRNVLRKLIQYEPVAHPVFLPAIMGVDTLEARIRSMDIIDTTYKKIGLRSMGVSLLSLFVLLGLMVTPVNAIELHEDGRDVVMLCSGSAACESVCRKQTLQQLQSFQPQYTPTTSNFSSVE
jgi:Zn-dependent protease with chaperone function